MKNMETMYLNMTPFVNLRTNMIIGKSRGEFARIMLKIHELDKRLKKDKDFCLDIQFPKEVTHVSDSFLKGFLHDTFKTVGPDAFIARVKFYAGYNINKDVKRFVNIMKVL